MFFFSSRRRHTRFDCDWSSDVCSSDLKNMERITTVNAEIEIPLSDAVKAVEARVGDMRLPADFTVGFGTEVEEQAKSFREIGRARVGKECRSRCWAYHDKKIVVIVRLV